MIVDKKFPMASETARYRVVEAKKGRLKHFLNKQIKGRKTERKNKKARRKKQKKEKIEKKE